MRKKQKITPENIESIIMAKVESSEISMKPRWYFVLGSLSLILGLVALCIGSIFLTNLTFFLLRQHGPMAQWRLESMLSSFPVWIPLLAVFGTVTGIWMLKKYDFSYKKNFALIALAFMISIVVAAYAIDSLGLNKKWSSQGPAQRFYQQINRQNQTLPENTRLTPSGKVKGTHRQNF